MMKSRDRFLRLGILVSAVVWSGAVLAQTEWVKLTLKGQWPAYPRGPALNVVVSGQYAYCAIGSGGLTILGLSNPANPQRVGGIASGYAQGVAVSGNYAYLMDGGYGLQVIDITNPASPQRVGGFDTNGWAVGVAVSGNYAYVADDVVGVQVIDISNPTHPQWVGEDETSLFAHGGVAISGNYAYVADDVVGVQVIDISNPAHPRRVGGHRTSGWAVGVAVLGHYAYVADGDAGLLIFEITELPAITRAERTANSLTLQWNEPAQGMKLQRATSLTNPDWVGLLGSETTNRVLLPIWSGNEFFRLVKP